MTSLARLSLANRTLVIMITLVLAGFGLFAIPSLKQQLFPSLEFPAAFTVASYPGAAPEIVEEQVTKPIESAFQGIAGVTDITSTSREGMSQVQVAYEYGTDIDQMIGKMQQAVSRIKAQLPADVDPQVVAGGTDDIPVMAIAVGDGGDQHAMVDKIEKIMVPELQSIEGVRDVTVSGARDEQVVIIPDQSRLALLGLSAAAIPDLLRANGVSIPAGTLTEDGKSLTVQIGDPVRTVKDLENLYLTPAAPAAGQGVAAGQRGGAGAGQSAGQGAGQSAAAGRGASQSAATAQTQARAAAARPKPVKLGDVADIKVEDASATTLTRTNGTPSLGVSITMVPDGNAVQISHDVNDALPDLTRALGDSAELTVVFDQAPYVERSIEDLTTEGLLGLAFAVVVILVFLLSVRSTLVTAVSIPLSVVIALIALWIGDYSLNLLTLGALTIAVGRVVDDSIVVLENIKRHLAYGEEKRRAILGAVREVSGAVTASTLTTVAVFLPIAFVGGMVGQLFSPFAITVTVALLASLLVALTVIPVLAYWFLKAPVLTPQEAQAVREDAERKELRSPLQRIYLPVLRFATRRRLITVLIGVVVFVATMALAPNLKTNFLDSSGNDTTQISQRMPAGTDLATTDAAAKKVEAVLAADGGVKSYQVTVGGGNRFLGGVGGGSDRASFSVTLKEGVETSALEDRLRERLKGLTGVGDITVGGSGGGFNSDQVQVIVQGSDQAALKTAATTVRDAMAGVNGLRDVASNLEDSVPRVEVHVDREKAAARGLTEAGIGQLVAQAFRGAPVGSIDVDGRSSDVILRAGGDAPDDIAAIRKLAIPTATGMVKLGDVADVVKAGGPTQITRQDGDRTATVSGTAAASDLGAITTKVTDKLKTLTLPAGVTYKIGGASSDQQDAFADLGVAMLLAVAIVFMIMVATFRSLVQPLILLVSIPFAATGAIGLLLATDTALGVPALIGMLMLIGIVVTNAIVLIDLINQYREQGLGVVEAVMEGGRRRLRPILMTAIATICALTPMALGVTGSGGFISQPLAIVVIGGLISSTLLTLVLVPTLYTMVERLKERMRRTSKQPASGDGDGDLTVYGKEALEPAK
ncbi:efflux RND transporter permease subunit [Microbispora sp. NEAU-D428]|uniref:efflux RND transporter permease subunit n=1 Tax=Microbispora sitophila TaxID=2771537 RepID=UPI0018662ABD|nr:efflux RND transporter permease subunit [Microbispora sitophila]MBE3012842.1 efflux RND transporter permease subunit [Microbispora sitophila]